VPIFFIRSRHLAIHVDSEEDLLEYRRRLDGSEWPVEMQIQHETIESIYTHDPNGYMFEMTRALRPVTPQEDLDAELTIDALVDVVSQPDPSMAALLARKAELIVERAAAWEEQHLARAGTDRGSASS
jgi:Glyoxalase/Bleomycin resistance protein/Dioxygenase superfamily